MWKLAIAVVLLIFVGYILSLMVDAKEERVSIYDACYAAGGVPMLTNAGSFKLCLSTDAIITLDKGI